MYCGCRPFSPFLGICVSLLGSGLGSGRLLGRDTFGFGFSSTLTGSGLISTFGCSFSTTFTFLDTLLDFSISFTGSGLISTGAGFSTTFSITLGFSSTRGILIGVLGG